MKKDKMDVVLLSLISSLVLSGCHAATSSSGKVKVVKPLVTDTETVQEISITKDMIKKFVKNHDDEYGEIFYNLYDNAIHIEKKVFQGHTLYFFLYTPKDSLDTTLYQVRMKKGQIESLDYISCGSSDFFNFDIISISEGDFVTVYSASHMGNGNLELISMDSIPERKVNQSADYELCAIDGHYEDMEVEGKPTLSRVLENGILTPEYKDEDGDGNTDVVLRGNMEVYEYDKETKEHILKSKQKVCEVYLFDPDEKTFTLQSDFNLREKRSLTIGDTVVDNHELLNEIPCTEYKVQDIYQYHGKPDKTIDYKDEYSEYRHYLIYEGITYIVVNNKSVLSDDDEDKAEYIDGYILTSDFYSLSIGIQVGMKESELEESGIDFEKVTNGDDLDSELLSGKTGYLRKMKVQYDTIFYAESAYDENVALAIMVKDGTIVKIATDKLY